MEQPPVRPRAIKQFEAFWIGSICLSVLQIAIVTIWPTRFGYGPLYLGLIGVPLATALGLWVSRGRSNVAKWMILILVAGGLPGVLEVVAKGTAIGSRVVLVAQTIAQVAAVTFLFASSAREWLRRPAASVRP